MFIAEKLLNYDNGHDNIIPTYEKTYFVAIFCVGLVPGIKNPGAAAGWVWVTS